MKKRSLSIAPLAVAAKRSAAFIIRDESGGYLEPDRVFTLDIISVHDCRHRFTFEVRADSECRIEFSVEPDLTGEYKVCLYPPGSAWQDEPLWQLSFYAVPPELAGLIPYRGDLHMHTIRSDGEDTPAFTAAAARAAGLDFAAVTDHRVYEGFLEAAAEAKKLGIDVTIIPGEEINYCLGLGHIVSLNARKGVADQFPRNSKTAPRSELESFDNMGPLVDQVYETVADKMESYDLPPGVDRKLFGFYYGVTKKIREAGGTAITAHPFWSSHDTMDLIRGTLEHVLSEGLADAVEVFGGMSVEANLLSLSYTRQLEARGFGLPLVGSSDSHNALDGSLGRIWTVAFSRSRSIDDLMAAVKSGMTAPCLRLPNGTVVVTGAFPLVEYTYFLLREFFPLHDRLCAALGRHYITVLEAEEKDDRGNADRGNVDEIKQHLTRYYHESFAPTEDLYG